MDSNGTPYCLVAVAFLLSGCASHIDRYPLAEPVWQDDDQTPFSPRPEEYFSPQIGDFVDKTLLRPLSMAFKVDPGGEALNLNSMDEVPNSSWFTNRAGRGGYSMEDAIRGGCNGPPLDPAGPWKVVAAKRDGATPGFQIKDAMGRRYLLKFDGEVKSGLSQPERATAADVFGSRMYWAAGYWAPCNQLIYFDRAVMEIEDGATKKDELGRVVPLLPEDVDFMLALATQEADGTYRSMASEFLPGRPIGPWTYEDVRWDDPNDAIDHHERREIRGAYLWAAWIAHTDVREQNTLAVWMKTDEDGSGYVRHYYLDFGDCFGALNSDDLYSRRLSYSNYLDFSDLAADLFTFGARTPVWETLERGPAGNVFGYWNSEPFDPEWWDPGYPNPAFGRRTERDDAWAARILAFITPEMVNTWVDMGQFTKPLYAREAKRILLSRRETLLARFLGRLSPLSLPEVTTELGGASLCLRDLAVVGGVTSPEHRRYFARAMTDERDPLAMEGAAVVSGDRVCVPIPDAEGSETDPTYLVVEVSVGTVDPSFIPRPAWVHLYHLGGTNYRVVGLERPDVIDTLSGHRKPPPM